MEENFVTPRNDVKLRTVRSNAPHTTPSPLGRTVKNSSRRLSAAFKSPLRQSNESVGQVAVNANKEAQLEQEIHVLREKEIQMDKEIASLLAQGYQEEELNDHIQKLHDYNEIKDIGQMLLGRIAVHRGVTTKDLYKNYSLSLDD